MAYFVVIDNSHTICLKIESLSNMLGRISWVFLFLSPGRKGVLLSAEQNFTDLATLASLGHRGMHQRLLVEISTCI